MKVTYDSNSETIYDSRLANSATPVSLLPYMPLNKSMVLSDLTFDFQHDLFFRMDFRSLFLYDNLRLKLRLIDCFCELCSKYGGDPHKNDDEVDKSEIDLMDDDEYGVFTKKQKMDLSEDNGNKMTKEDHYERYMEIVDQLTAQYGNLQEEEYAMKVQTPLGELIYHYRQVLGHHHPKVSLFLLFLTYSQLVLIRGKRRKPSRKALSLECIIFYRYKQMHSHLMNAINAVSSVFFIDSFDFNVWLFNSSPSPTASIVKLCRH